MLADGCVTRRPFGRLADGTPVDAYTIRNGSLELQVTNYGAIVTSVLAPDRAGAMANVVLGFNRVTHYLPNPSYFGAVVGRFANRIASGLFELDGRTYALAANDGPNHLHGGCIGFDQRVWSATIVDERDEPGVRLARTSPAGEEGYPGTLSATVTYRVASHGMIRIDYRATTDAPTIVNLTQHSYFNLSGSAAATIVDHELRVRAHRFLPVDRTLIPTGERRAVEQTPFDFRKAARIGDRLRCTDDQLAAAGGFDHCFELDALADGDDPAVSLFDPGSGRTLLIDTTAPGVQFYDGHLIGHRGVCLETQGYPDAPNQAQFPSATLRPGQIYQSTTTWRFSQA